jgi:gas vesicle protein
MAENDSTSSAVDRLTYLLIGAGIGATVALLFAPKSGRELRGDIADASRKSLDYTNEQARRIGEKAQDVYGQTTQKAQELYGQTAQKAQDLYGQTAQKAQELIDTGKETVAAKREQLQAAIDAGKDAYAEEKDRARGAKSLGSGGEAAGAGNATPGNA